MSARSARYAQYAAVIAAAAGSTALFLHALHHRLPRVEWASVTSSVNPQKERAKLPYHRNGQPDEKLDFAITLDYRGGEPSLFVVRPDDCIEAFSVNDKPVKLEGDALAHQCDWDNGFTIDLGPYLKDGSNHISIRVVNKKGKTGLQFMPQGGRAHD